MPFVPRKISLKIKGYFSSFGRRNAVCSRPLYWSQSANSSTPNTIAESFNVSSHVENCDNPSCITSYPRRLSIFDKITGFAGSTVVFGLVIVVLIGWMIAGIVLKGPDNWQVAMSDGSSIQVYITNTFLIHQQFLNYDDILDSLANIESRSLTAGKMLKILQDKGHFSTILPTPSSADVERELPPESAYYRFCNWILNIIGSPIFIIVYWIGIFIWLGFGPSMQWSNFWQLVINTATAVELTFTTVFLQHIRRMQMNYNDKYIKCIHSADERILTKLRFLTGTQPQSVPVQIPKQPINKIERCIDYYGDLLGGILGMTIFIFVLALWVAIGPVMNWNGNWWLIIGTYTGLVSFVDDFVLRNIQLRDNDYICALLEQASELDDENLRIFEVNPVKSIPPQQSLFQSIVEVFILTFSRWEAVIASILVVLAMLAIATGMMWNETGQLICNTPTMIFDGFLTIILIHGQKSFYNMRQTLLRKNLVKRHNLLRVLEGLIPIQQQEKS